MNEPWKEEHILFHARIPREDAFGCIEEEKVYCSLRGRAVFNGAESLDATQILFVRACLFLEGV